MDFLNRKKDLKLSSTRAFQIMCHLILTESGNIIPTYSSDLPTSSPSYNTIDDHPTSSTHIRQQPATSQHNQHDNHLEEQYHVTTFDPSTTSSGFRKAGLTMNLRQQHQQQHSTLSEVPYTQTLTGTQHTHICTCLHSTHILTLAFYTHIT